jgi:Subtilase family/Secretion system C-terminal sorting domain
LAYNFPYYLIVKSADNKRTENGPPAGESYFLRNTNQTSIVERNRNDGYDVIPAEANAKNILTVGAAEVNFTNGTMQGFKIANFSGWGPTDDGRIKPDLLGVGKDIISSMASSNSAYALFSGTSTASANVSGTLFLLQELFYNLNNKQFMRSATLKGLALHTADKPAGKTSPSYEYGWGLLNAEKAARVLLNKDLTHVLNERTLAAKQTFRQKIIANGGPLLITICWTDPEGTPTQVLARNLNNRTPKLINDLDVRVTNADNFTWFPWTLDPAQPNKAAVPGDNIRDNVEQIWVPQTSLGQVFTVTIRHKNTLQSNGQPYSLIVSGVAPQDCEGAVRIVKGNDTTLCGNGRMRLQVRGENALTYEWSKDGKSLITNESPFIDITQAGKYSLKVTGYQCTAKSREVVVQSASLTAAITPAGSLTICPSSNIRLTASTGTNYRYQWLRNGQMLAGATSPVLNTTEAGNYSVAISSNLCTAISNSTQLLSAAIQPTISTNTGTIIPKGGSIRLTTNTGDGLTYQWYKDNRAIRTATGPRYSATESGNYTVLLTQNKCSLLSKPLQLTSVLDVLPTSLKPQTVAKPSIYLENINLKLFPNPATTELVVAYTSENSYDLTASITNLNGVILSTKPLNDNGSDFVNRFDVSLLPSGLYIVQISDGNRIVSKSFVKL